MLNIPECFRRTFHIVIKIQSLVFPKAQREIISPLPRFPHEMLPHLPHAPLSRPPPWPPSPPSAPLRGYLHVHPLTHSTSAPLARCPVPLHVFCKRSSDLSLNGGRCWEVHKSPWNVNYLFIQNPKVSKTTVLNFIISFSPMLQKRQMETQSRSLTPVLTELSLFCLSGWSVPLSLQKTRS